MYEAHTQWFFVLVVVVFRTQPHRGCCLAAITAAASAIYALMLGDCRLPVPIGYTLFSPITHRPRTHIRFELLFLNLRMVGLCPHYCFPHCFPALTPKVLIATISCQGRSALALAGRLQPFAAGCYLCQLRIVAHLRFVGFVAACLWQVPPTCRPNLLCSHALTKDVWEATDFCWKKEALKRDQAS
jgi:hypothetical protein